MSLSKHVEHHLMGAKPIEIIVTKEHVLVMVSDDGVSGFSIGDSGKCVVRILHPSGIPFATTEFSKVIVAAEILDEGTKDVYILCKSTEMNLNSSKYVFKVQGTRRTYYVFSDDEVKQFEKIKNEVYGIIYASFLYYFIKFIE